MNDLNAQQAPEAQAAPPERPRAMRPPKIKMDRSRHFSEVHGTRTPGDLYYGVAFIQDGLLYTAEGVLILDHPVYTDDTEEGDKRRRALEKKLRKHNQEAAKRSALEVRSEGELEDVEDGEVDDEEGEDEDELEPVNLSEWIRGQQQVEWNDVTQAIAQRYKKRVASIADAVPFLVKEGVCPPGQVAKRFKKYLD